MISKKIGVAVLSIMISAASMAASDEKPLIRPLSVLNTHERAAVYRLADLQGQEAVLYQYGISWQWRGAIYALAPVADKEAGSCRFAFLALTDAKAIVADLYSFEQCRISRKPEISYIDSSKLPVLTLHARVAAARNGQVWVDNGFEFNFNEKLGVFCAIDSGAPCRASYFQNR